MSEGQTIFSNKKGKVDICPGTESHVKVQMPTNRSFLGLVGANPTIMDGDDFRKDGFVYNRDGQPYRKWFINLYDPHGNNQYGRIWEPKLEDISALEALRWWALEWTKRWYERKHGPIYRAICALCDEKENISWKDPLVIHAQASHPRMNPEKYRWIEFHFNPIDPYFKKSSVDFPYSYSWDWIEGEVDDPQHVDLGQPFYEIDHHQRTVQKRKHVFVAAFDMAIDRLIWGETLPKAEWDQTLQLEINGRMYWFNSERTRDPTRPYVWKPLHWPESDLMKMTIQ